MPRRFTRRQLLAAGGGAIAASTFIDFPRALAGLVPRKGGDTRHVLMFTKSAGYEHSVVHREGDALGLAERVLVELGSEHGIEVHATKDGRIFNPSDLDHFDAFFFYTTDDLTQAGNDGTPPMTAEGKQLLLDAVRAGKGFLGSHCASDTFHSPGDRAQNQPMDQRDPYIQMLGGEFIVHGAQQPAFMRVADPAFPGVEEMGEGREITDEWYALKNFAPDLHVVLVQETEGMEGDMYHRPPYPATWIRRHGDGRVFYTSMGHREDVWENPLFQGLLLGGLAWAFGDVDLDAAANIDEVTPHASELPG